MPEPVIVVDELNTSGLAQASANSAVPCRKPTECRCNPVGVVHTGAETLDVSTVIDTDGACDSVRIELQGVGAGFRPGLGAPELLDLSRPTQSFVKHAERMGGAARRVHSAEELADARRGAFIESRTAPN
jgi:acetolactate synthase-1/2/3 large subunit